MKICIEIQLYLRKSKYICENRNISAKIGIYQRKTEYICENRNICEKRNISAKIELYLRKTEYICENRIISQKNGIYLRKSSYISERDNYLIKVRIVSSIPSLYGVLGMGPMRFSYFSPSRMNPSFVIYMISTTSFMKGLNKPSILMMFLVRGRTIFFCPVT